MGSDADGTTPPEEPRGRCPECGATGLEIIYGLPSFDLHEKSLRGEVALGGCVVFDESPRWSCPACGATWGRVEVIDPTR